VGFSAELCEYSVQSTGGQTAAGLLLPPCVGGEVHRLKQASEEGMQELKLLPSCSSLQGEHGVQVWGKGGGAW